MVDFDMTKRTDAARKSRKRAEMKLSKEFSKPGGLDDEMRFQLSELKREQTLLRKELQALRFESSLSARGISSIHELWEKSPNDSYASRDDDVSLHRRHSDYGRNFHGYVSTPGSKKIMKTSAKQLDRSLNGYCKKIEEVIHQEHINQKLEEQKKENQLVDEKLKTWMSSNAPPKRPRYHRRLLHQTSFVKHDDVQTNAKGERSSISKSSDYRYNHLPAINGHFQSSSDVEKLNGNTGDEESQSAKIHPSIASFSKESSRDLLFDGELYAPDGRLRMAHRMPEVQQAFNEAKKTRYLRSKSKRDFEVQLSVDEVFK